MKIAGIAGKIIEYPFDTIKVRLQSQPSYPQPLYTGPVDCFRKSFRDEGISGLYRGISAPLIGAAMETSSLFFSYRVAQEILRSTALVSPSGAPLSVGALAVCGAASGAFTSFVLTPIELVKCQMQVPSTSSSLQVQKPVAIIVSIFRHHGLLGFWHGQLGTFIRETGGSAAWFGAYEGVSALFRKFNRSTQPQSITAHPTALPPEKLFLWQQLLAGATAGVAYILSFFPADTMKSLMQTEAFEGRAAVEARKRRTFWGEGKRLWKAHGLRGLYRGCGITAARAAPSSAFIFAIYESLQEAFP